MSTDCSDTVPDPALILCFSLRMCKTPVGRVKVESGKHERHAQKLHQRNALMQNHARGQPVPKPSFDSSTTGSVITKELAISQKTAQAGFVLLIRLLSTV